MIARYLPLTPEAKEISALLGEMLIRWNETETAFRNLIFAAVNPPRPGHRIEVLIAHLGNVALRESLTAIADDYDEPMKGHLKHCASLFDANRVYRNHFAHDPIIFAQTEEGETIAFTQTQTARGGALRLSQGNVKLSDLQAFRDQLDSYRAYQTELRLTLAGLRDAAQLPSLEKPQRPPDLRPHYLNLIELERQPLA